MISTRIQTITPRAIPLRRTTPKHNLIHPYTHPQQQPRKKGEQKPPSQNPHEQGKRNGVTHLSIPYIVENKNEKRKRKNTATPILPRDPPLQKIENREIKR